MASLELHFKPKCKQGHRYCSAWLTVAFLISCPVPKPDLQLSPSPPQLVPTKFFVPLFIIFHFSEPHSESRNSALAGSLSFSISGEKNKDGVVEKKCRVYSSASALSTTGSFTGTAVVYGCGLGWDTYGTHNEFLKVTYYNFDRSTFIQTTLMYSTVYRQLHQTDRNIPFLLLFLISFNSLKPPFDIHSR